MIFTRASDIGANPVALSFVCKNWHDAMRENQPVVGKLQYADMNNSMQKCMNLYWAQPIRNMQLTHTNPETNEKTVMNIPAGADALRHVFNSENPDIFKNVRITTSVDEFFKVKGDNENKLVVLASPYALIKYLYADKFSKAIVNWYPEVAQVALFWRYGNWEDLSWYDYLVTSSVGKLSDVNLYENWRYRAARTFLHKEILSHRLEALEFHVSFLNSPKNN
jgi:hypothetical protein